MIESAVTVGSIVQIDPAHDAHGFGGCLLVVTEVQSWGVIGFVQIPGSGQAFYRVASDRAWTTGGHAAWVLESMAAGTDGRADG